MAISSPLFQSHVRTVPSDEAVATTSSRVGLNAQDHTASSWQSITLCGKLFRAAPPDPSTDWSRDTAQTLNCPRAPAVAT
eukprot:2303768-Rhodomonas_salina.1